MMKRTGLVLLGVLHSALLWGAAESSQSMSSYVLRRIVVPRQRLIEGGAHNLVQIGCMNKELRIAVQAFLGQGEQQDCENMPIPVEDKRAILIGVAKHRFSLFQSDKGSLILRKYAKGTTAVKWIDSVLGVEGFSGSSAEPCPVELEVYHGGAILCKCLQAGISNTISRTVSMPATIHMPPEASYGGHQPSSHRVSHSVGCMCAGCVQTLPPAPSYPAPTSHSAQAAPYKPLPVPPSLVTPELYAKNPFTSSH